MSRRQRKTSYWQDAPQPRDQLVLFQETLDSRIPDDHPVRLVDEILGQLDWSVWEGQYHGSRGQPPVHPSVLCKAILFAMLRGIRSSRQIEYQLKHSIDFMWLVSGRTIDHTTLSEFRRRHLKALKDVYRQLIRMALELKVAKLAELCIDGSRVLANASGRQRWTQASLGKLLNQLETDIAAALAELGEQDELDDLLDVDQPHDKLPPELANKIARRAQLDQVMNQLKEMDAARKARGRADVPAQIPKTDTDSRILPNKEGGFAANYTPLAVTETENGFIVATDVSVGSVEHSMLLPLVEQVRADYSQEVVRVLADGAYCTGENLRGCEQREIELISPLAEPNPNNNPAQRADPTEPVPAPEVAQLPIKPQTRRFASTAFIYDESADCYYCPAGKKLEFERTQRQRREGISVLQRVYRCDGCDGCPLAPKCKTKPDSATGRSVSRDAYEPERSRHRERMRNERCQTLYRKRSHFAETQFGALKTVFALRRFLLRGHQGVRTEWLWGCTAYNIKKLLGILAAMRANIRPVSPMSRV